MKESLMNATIKINHGENGRVKVERYSDTVLDLLIQDENGKKMVANFEKLISIFSKESMAIQFYLKELLYEIKYSEIFEYPIYFNESLEVLINNLTDEVNDLLTDDEIINRFDLAGKAIKLMQSIENLKIEVS